MATFQESLNRVIDKSLDSSFKRSDKYPWYEGYQDNHYSFVDNKKRIKINPVQINNVKEENSQAIPFELHRFYDGIDLMDMTLRIYFVNAQQQGSYSNIVNVTYNDSRIRFLWILDGLVTDVAGKIKFEIQATGSNSDGDHYYWTTRPNEELNILRSLSHKGMIQPENDWVMQFIREVDQKVALAQEAEELAQQHLNDTIATGDRIEAQANQIHADTDATMRAKEEAQASAQEAARIVANVTADKAHIDNMKQSVDESKLHIDNAVQQFDSSSTTALNILNETKDAHVTEIANVSSAEVEKVKTAGTNQVNLVKQEGISQSDAITALTDTKKVEINTTSDSEVSRIIEAASTQIDSITTVSNEQKGFINNVGAEQAEALTLLGTEQKNLVTEEGTSQVGAIRTAATESQELVSKAGVDQVGLIKQEGTSQAQNVVAAKDNLVSELAAETNNHKTALNQISNEISQKGTESLEQMATTLQDNKNEIDQYVETKKDSLKGETGNVQFTSFKVEDGRLKMYSDPKLDKVKFKRVGSRLQYSLNI